MNPTDTSSPEFSSTESSRASATEDQGSTAGAVRGTAEKAKRAAGRAMGQAKDKATQLASDRKGMAADKIDSYTSALRSSAQNAEQQEDRNIAELANQAADRLERVADYVRNADMARIQQDASDVARRHPTLFLSGMLVAGLVLGNLAKASVQSLNEDNDGADDASADEGDFPSAGRPAYDDGHEAPVGYRGEEAGEDFTSGLNPNPQL